MLSQSATYDGASDRSSYQQATVFLLILYYKINTIFEEIKVFTPGEILSFTFGSLSDTLPLDHNIWAKKW